jgi:hypothetical protein
MRTGRETELAGSCAVGSFSSKSRFELVDTGRGESVKCHCGTSHIPLAQSVEVRLVFAIKHIFEVPWSKLRERDH